MTLTQLCASILYIASLEFPLPEYNRHWLARKILLQCLREPKRNWMYFFGEEEAKK